MANAIGFPSAHGLEHHGLRNLDTVYWTLPSPALVERIVRRREGLLAHLGPVVVRTGHHTGRSPNDKFIVQDGTVDSEIWWGPINRPMDEARFERLALRLTAYFQGREVYVQDVVAGAHPEHQVPVRVITETAWHSLFARNIFLRLPIERLSSHVPRFTIVDAPRFHAIPEEDGTNSEVFIVINFERGLILVGGSSYAGEIKKAVFTVMNYLLPKQGVLSMHCSANIGAAGDVALFFGLSGTGKTTLSSDPDRRLIGDDEHGWGEDGVFNIEGGCYAKTVRLNPVLEPLIWEATRRFATVLENAAIRTDTRRVDFDDISLTENTRAAYPLGFIDNHEPSGRGGHPKNIFFLTADAFGVLPPLARLTPDQAMYYFLSGYTSKLAGTEKGLGSEPQATFSACFGAPFLPLPPSAYGRLLGEKLGQHRAIVWLINTGWTGGAFGSGERIQLGFTRAMIRAALSGSLEGAAYRTDPNFGLAVPEHCRDVPDEILEPGRTWADEKAYDHQAQVLAGRFAANFKQFAGEVSPAVAQAGPRPNRG
ncbi:MAG: phosphoenolpyruvate carboxykinase (ATP) [Anaerolineales bacterium]|nr:phosphoenolpyruvate carboxykinase (ATP) [Anaerolineales bacterium]